jgi:hypothetical protein
METTFFGKWFWHKARGIELLEPHKARQRHERGESYVASLREGEQLRFVIDFAATWVSVVFFDGAGRWYLQYDFREEGAETLFLKGATHRSFEEEGETISSSHQFNFEPDGSYIAVRTTSDGAIEVAGVADPSLLLAKRPAFGQYEDLCVSERLPPNAA